MLGLLTFAAQLKRFAPRAVQGVRADGESGRGRPAEPASASARSAGHETRDLSGGALGKLVLLLGAVVLCLVFAMAGLRYWVSQDQAASLPPMTKLQNTAVPPPEPHLQTDPVAQLERLREREARQLGGYAYLDSGRTRARIPIERAMTLTIGNDLSPPP